MTASEIAETLLNGNIALARSEILSGDGEYYAATFALDVVAELASLMWDGGPLDAEPADVLRAAHEKVRRCLEGAP